MLKIESNYNTSFSVFKKIKTKITNRKRNNNQSPLVIQKNKKNSAKDDRRSVEITPFNESSVFYRDFFRCYSQTIPIPSYNWSQHNTAINIMDS